MTYPVPPSVSDLLSLLHAEPLNTEPEVLVAAGDEAIEGTKKIAASKLSVNAAPFIPKQYKVKILQDIPIALPCPDVAHRWVAKLDAKQLNDSEALYKKGEELLLTGKRKGEKRALACFQIAAYLQNPKAMHAIGDLYSQGKADLKEWYLAKLWHEVSAKCASGQARLIPN